MERFLGVYIDKNLILAACVKGKWRGWYMYCCKIRSIATYAAPAWITFLSESQLNKLERVEKYALKAIFPEKNYIDALKAAGILSLREFCVKLIRETFYKILNNPKHPLHNRLPERSQRPTRNTSQRFIHEKYRTIKRSNSFIPWCVRQHDSNNSWLLWESKTLFFMLFLSILFLTNCDENWYKCKLMFSIKFSLSHYKVRKNTCTKYTLHMHRENETIYSF